MSEIWGIIYVRLSRDEEGQTSTADQEHHCCLLLNRLGIPNERIIVFCEDPGTSGFKDVPLPERDKFMAAIGPNKIAASWMIDRISRKGMEDSGKLLRQFKEAGCRYVTVADGVDTSMPGSNLNAGIRAIMANEYSEGLSRNVKRGKESGAKEGKWNGGQRWYGYSPDPDGVWRGPKVIDVAEAKILHEIRERYVHGERMLNIAAELNSRGITTVQGGEWRSENMLRLILNERYAGIRVHNGNEYPAVWPAIFTEAEHLEIEQHRLSEERMKTWPKGPTGARSALLTGFVYCHCGNKMASKRKGGSGGRRRYVCMKKDNRGRIIGCGKTVRAAEPLELLVVEELMYKLDTPDLAALLAPTDDKGKVNELIATQNTLKQRLEELHSDYYGQTDDALRISRANFVQQKTELDARLEDTQRKIADVINRRTTVHLEVGQTVKDAWERGSLDWRRRLLDLVLDKVIIMPSKPGGVATWRGWRFKPEDTKRVWKC